MMMGKAKLAGCVCAVTMFGAVLGGASCGQTPINTPIRSFEGAQKVAVVCLQVNGANGKPLSAVAGGPGGVISLPQNDCAPVPANWNGSGLPNHLFALVTQTTRGELAVVDLTAGSIVDEDHSTPGINFIPVGTNPTDVVVAPDATAAFVSSAAPRSPAIYGIPSVQLLGDAINGSALPLTLASLTACALPQPPLALAVTTLLAAAAGGAVSKSASPYAILALLGSAKGVPATLVTIDPQKSGLVGGVAGALPACSVIGTAVLRADMPPSWAPGPTWPDGVPYVDGGAPSEPLPLPGMLCSGSFGSMTGVDAGADGGTDAGAGTDADAGAGAGTDADAGADVGTDAGFPLSFGPLSPPSPRFMAIRSDVPLVYIADNAVPLIHVIDVSDPTAPHELAPLLATSVVQPSRRVRVGGIALSPPTRDYKVYLYAIDAGDGSVMVYDVSDPAASSHVPLLRPHAELNPFSPPDRLTFSSPVATLAFVQHDWPVPASLVTSADPIHAYSGLLCNPNPNAHPGPSTFNDLGAAYRVDQASQIQAQGSALNFPTRLRGIFAFVTLTNGTIVTVDVDDWDAPCRRPDPMSAGAVVDPSDPTQHYAGGAAGALVVPEPAPASGDLDPYHAPITYQNKSLPESAAVTLEPFFPVSAPNRVRSSTLLRNDPTSGDHAPNLTTAPVLVDVNGSPVAAAGATGFSPSLLPTALEAGTSDPTLVQNPTEPNPSLRRSTPPTGLLGSTSNPPVPGVRLSFDDPTATQNQDWTVTYEGVLPSSAGIVADIAASPLAVSSVPYDTLTFTTTGADLCGVGVEDFSIGQARASEALQQMSTLGLPGPASLPQWTSDYVELTDDLLPQGDAYWSQSLGSASPAATAAATAQAPDGSPPPIDNCWDGSGLDTPDARYNACQQTFGAAADADIHYARDFPILHAYKDHLVVGRFGWNNGEPEQTTNRVVVASDPANSPKYLRFATCCFHRQAGFKVRAGGEWVAVGQNGLALLHHVVADPSADNACKLSCDPRDALLNARSFDVPWGKPTSRGGCTAPAIVAGAQAPAITRNQALAMRNPMFSYVTWAGCGPLNAARGDHTVTARDMTWRFSVGGGFTPLTISLSGTSGASVNPQSMLFIGSLGQLAVVDGAQQGLVLIDLNAVAFAQNPYF